MLYLFDIDGTLLLSGGAGRIALNRAFAGQYGIDGAMDGISPAGKTDPIIVGEMFARHLGRVPSNDEIERLLADYVPILREQVGVSSGYHLMPYVYEALDFLSRAAEVNDSLCLGLATGNIRAAAQIKLDRAGLWERFVVGGFGDDSGDRGELVAHAIARGRRHIGVALESSQIVVIGDTVRDIVAAHACGVRCIAVTTGSADRATLEAAGADVVFDSLAELPDWHRAHS